MFHLSRRYGYIWQSILALSILATLIPKLVVEEPWKDWSFHSDKSVCVMHTNDVYHKLVENKPWLAKKGLFTWRITRYVKWWCQVNLDVG